VITNPPNLRLAVDTAVKRMFVRMFKSPFGHTRNYADAAHQQEGGSASPLSVDLGEQLGLVACHELQPSNVIAKLVELPKRIQQGSLIRRDQRRGNVVELARRVMLHLTIGFNLAL
jgi:hypothetical protein